MADIAGIFFTIITTIIAVVDKSLFKQLKNNNALSEDSAITLKLGNAITKKRLKRHLSRKVIIEKDSKFYFDQDNYNSFRKKRGKFLILLITIIIVLFSMRFLY